MNIFKKRISLSASIIIVFLITIPLLNFNHHNYSKGDGVIIWDVKSYYAYLPAAFIYNDLSLDFMQDYPDKFGKWIWPIITPTGKKAILTTMGLSVMYSPFFFIAHQYALRNAEFEPDGYSMPYHIALTFSAYVYFILALILLRKLLLKYFTELSTAITLLAVGGGTNLLHYVTYSAPMSHAYNFFLIIAFVYLLERWYNTYKWSDTVLLGLTAGLISLIRPTNTIILLLIPFYQVYSFKSLRTNFCILLKRWSKLICITIAFILVWVPQFIYWYKVSGRIFYFSYEEVDSAFYFLNPQVFNILFSFKKGWYIYTPIMLLATIGIYFLIKRKNPFAIGTSIYFIVNLYILSSWWSWWFGGGYGNRAFIDGYGIMAFPLAALLDWNKKVNLKKIALVFLVLILTALNIFQVQQYRHGSIHYFWMNREAYWETFLRLKPTCKYWNILLQPNVEKARKGVYETTYFIDSNVTREELFNKLKSEVEKNAQLLDSLTILSQNTNNSIEELKEEHINDKINSGLAQQEYKELRIDYLKRQMRNCMTWKKEIERKARRNALTFDEMATIEAERIFDKYSQKYLKEFY